MTSTLTSRDTAIMAGFATGYFAVVHIDTGPASRWRNMASATIIGRSGMVARLAWRSGIIMTGHTGAYHFVMVDVLGAYRNPRCRTGLVTGSAVVSGVNMATALACGSAAIMTTDASTDNLCVVNRG